MSIDIDYFTLHRLTEKAFRFEESDKKELKNKIFHIITSSSSNDEIIEKVVELIGEDLFTRKLHFAATTADPVAALKPKGRIVRRVAEEQTTADVQLPPTALTEDEMQRRLLAAKEASEKNKTFYGMIYSSDDDDDHDDDDGELNNDEMESLIKDQIISSQQLAAHENTETKEEFENFLNSSDE